MAKYWHLMQRKYDVSTETPYDAVQFIAGDEASIQEIELLTGGVASILALGSGTQLRILNPANLRSTATVCLSSGHWFVKRDVWYTVLPNDVFTGWYSPI